MGCPVIIRSLVVHILKLKVLWREKIDKTATPRAGRSVSPGKIRRSANGIVKIFSVESVSVLLVDFDQHLQPQSINLAGSLGEHTQ